MCHLITFRSQRRDLIYLYVAISKHVWGTRPVLKHQSYLGFSQTHAKWPCSSLEIDDKEKYFWFGLFPNQRKAVLLFSTSNYQVMANYEITNSAASPVIHHCTAAIFHSFKNHQESQKSFTTVQQQYFILLKTHQESQKSNYGQLNVFHIIDSVIMTSAHTLFEKYSTAFKKLSFFNMLKVNLPICFHDVDNYFCQRSFAWHSWLSF